jgi:hypothetical protein
MEDDQQIGDNLLMKELLSASKDGDVQVIQDLLGKIDINHQDNEGHTAYTQLVKKARPR